MKLFVRALLSSFAILLFLTTYTSVIAQKGIEDCVADVNGVRLHYLVAGKRRAD